MEREREGKMCSLEQQLRELRLFPSVRATTRRSNERTSVVPKSTAPAARSYIAGTPDTACVYMCAYACVMCACVRVCVYVYVYARAGHRITKARLTRTHPL